MLRTAFYLKNKIKRQIEWNGREFTFTRYKQDRFHQVTDDEFEEIVIKGFYHEAGGYGGMLNIELYERDGSRNPTKMKPMILCLYEDGNQLKMDDVVIISGTKYKVVDKSNVQNYDVAYDVSLEAVNDYDDEV